MVGMEGLDPLLSPMSGEALIQTVSWRHVVEMDDVPRCDRVLSEAVGLSVKRT